MSKKSFKRKRYTDEFKAEAVAVRLVEGRGDRTVAEM
jgi:transposase-like protein